MGFQSILIISIQNELWNIVKKGSKISGFLFLLFGLMVVGVSAYVYQQTTTTVSQNIVEIATLTVKNSDLGDINEGQTLLYTSIEVPNLVEAIKITTTTAPVYLHFNSDIDSLGDSYSTYNINVLYNTVPPTGTGTGTACTLTLSSPDYSSVTLDAAGTWKFDFSVEATADSVDADTLTSVSIVVGAESDS